MRPGVRKVGASRKKTGLFKGAGYSTAEPPARFTQNIAPPSVAAIEAVYDAALNPSFWPNALQAIADSLGDIGAILLWRRDDGQFGSIASPKVVAAQKDFEQEGWMANDVRALRAAERGYFLSGEPFTDRHVCTDEEIRTNPSYTQFQARHGLGWFGAVAVSPDPHLGVVLSVHRVRTMPPFSDTELAAVARLGRHVEKSLRLSSRLFDAELSKLGLGEALTRVGIGVFVLDSSGRVTFVNPAGRRLLGNGLALVRDRLLVNNASERYAVENMVQQATHSDLATTSDEQKPILIHRPEGKRPVAMYVLPIAPSSHPSTQFLAHACAIVLAIDPEASEPADPALVRDVLGLTLGEARMAALVGSGLPPREAAKKLGITEVTARAVLKHVFSKTGVSRQSELVALLSRMMLH